MATRGRDYAPAEPTIGLTGVVYLLHFDRRFQHAAHYTGWALDLDSRMTEHARGRGARLTAVVLAAGIGWTLARTWDGDRYLERRIKNRGSAVRQCPVCRGEVDPSVLPHYGEVAA